MPKDLTSNFQDGIPYELDVDIIKDCTTLSNEIKDVFDIIDKDNNKELLEKVYKKILVEKIRKKMKIKFICSFHVQRNRY